MAPKAMRCHGQKKSTAGGKGERGLLWMVFDHWRSVKLWVWVVCPFLQLPLPFSNKYLAPPRGVVALTQPHITSHSLTPLTSLAHSCLSGDKEEEEEALLHPQQRPTTTNHTQTHTHTPSSFHTSTTPSVPTAIDTFFICCAYRPLEHNNNNNMSTCLRPQSSLGIHSTTRKGERRGIPSSRER
jgi:hypothetical protein